MAVRPGGTSNTWKRSAGRSSRSSLIQSVEVIGAHNEVKSVSRPKLANGSTSCRDESAWHRPRASNAFDSARPQLIARRRLPAIVPGPSRGRRRRRRRAPGGSRDLAEPTAKSEGRYGWTPAIQALTPTRHPSHVPASAVGGTDSLSGRSLGGEVLRPERLTRTRCPVGGGSKGQCACLLNPRADNVLTYSGNLGGGVLQRR
jgi:hypothetical protein